MTNTLAPGCCSSIEPCAHQRQDPTTICATCSAAKPAPAATIELVYGLLWQLPSRARETLVGVRLARQALLAQLDKAGQARGITAARQLLAAADPRKNPRTDDDATPKFLLSRGKYPRV